MRRVVWSESAFSDFEQAIFYVAERNVSAARLVANRVDAAARQLAEMPVGRPGRVLGTYEKPVLRTPCIIAYAVSDSAITILRLIHGSRDWPEGDWPA
jgi:toxin ParE1/3/4